MRFLFIGTLLISCASFTSLHDYPSAHRTLYVSNFTNSTFEGSVNWDLTDHLRREVLRRDNFRLTQAREEAAFWLTGEMVAYRTEGRMYDNYRNPVRYEAIAVCKVRLRSNPGGFSGTEETILLEEFTARVDYSEKEGYQESALQARSRMFRAMSSDINDSIEASFLKFYLPKYAPEK